MKITGTVKMIKTPGRTDRFVKKQLLTLMVAQLQRWKVFYYIKT